MNCMWWFKEATPGDRARESQVEKFFNSDAVANRSNAIVREGIQNSLDAALGDSIVRVRIAIGIWPIEETGPRLATYTRGFSDHFDVEPVRSKIHDAPDSGEAFRYLVFEDFNTSGLEGDPSEWWPDQQGQNNPFFNYFRAEGISDKHEGARGRHGVGRLVFMFASRVHSIFGLTRRSNGGTTEELLMGTSVLRNHWLNGKPFLPDGLFGVQDQQESRLTLPVAAEDAAFIERFKQDFGIARKQEKGLSVVVPWLSQEVTVDEILKSVVSGYFHPILHKKLVVEVVSETGEQYRIDGDTLDSVIETLTSGFSDELKPTIALAKAAMAATEYVKLNPPRDGRPHWDASIIDEPMQQAIHDRLETGEVIAIRVPTYVRLKNDEPTSCYFDVFLTRDAGLNDGKITFIREGIIVTSVRPRRTSGIRALVVVEEGPLASFLGDSENPSHTEWQRELVRDKYKFHAATIEYVVQSVPSILSIVSQQQRKADASLLIDLFSLPADEGIRTRHKKQKKKGGGEVEPVKLDLPLTPKRFIIGKRANGFVVQNGDPYAVRPPQLAIKVAYGVRRGSPFSKYNRADFCLGLGGVECALRGCEFIDHEDNWMLVDIQDDDFEIAVTGFDTSHRDLHVDVRVKGEETDAADEVDQRGETNEPIQEVADAATT